MLIRASGRNGRIAEYRMLPPSGDHTGHVYAPANAEPSRSAFLGETSFLSVPYGFTVYIVPSIAAIAIRSTDPVATTRVGIGTGSGENHLPVEKLFGPDRLAPWSLRWPLL